MAVATDQGHARLGESQFGAEDVHDALMAAAGAVEGHAELGTVEFQLLHLPRGDGIGDGQAAVMGWNAVIDGGDRAMEIADLQTALAQPIEGLGAGDLMEQLQIDVKQGGLTIPLGDHVRIPELVVEGAWGHVRSFVGTTNCTNPVEFARMQRLAVRTLIRGIRTYSCNSWFAFQR